MDAGQERAKPLDEIAAELAQLQDELDAYAKNVERDEDQEEDTEDDGADRDAVEHTDQATAAEEVQPSESAGEDGAEESEPEFSEEDDGIDYDDTWFYSTLHVHAPSGWALNDMSVEYEDIRHLCARFDFDLLAPRAGNDRYGFNSTRFNALATDFPFLCTLCINVHYARDDLATLQALVKRDIAQYLVEGLLEPLLGGGLKWREDVEVLVVVTDGDHEGYDVERMSDKSELSNGDVAVELVGNLGEVMFVGTTKASRESADEQ